MISRREFIHVSGLAVAGVALGGCPLASAVSLISAEQDRPLPALYVRKQVKDHGSRRLVEGEPEVKIHGEWIPVKAHVTQISGLSARLSPQS